MLELPVPQSEDFVILGHSAMGRSFIQDLIHALSQWLIFWHCHIICFLQRFCFISFRVFAWYWREAWGMDCFIPDNNTTHRLCRNVTFVIQHVERHFCRTDCENNKRSEPWISITLFMAFGRRFLFSSDVKY